MECSHCASRHWLIRWFLYRTTSLDMVLDSWTHNYHDPGQSHGHGQSTGKAWYCLRCGHQEEYTPDDPEPLFDDEDSYDEE